MAKKLVSLLLALTLAVVCGAALAETTTTTTRALLTACTPTRESIPIA